MTAFALLPPLVVAGLISALGTWLLGRVARRIGAVSRVQPDRWHRSGEVPRLAGPAMLAAILPWISTVHAVILSAVCLIGVADDISALRPAAKAVILLVVALLAGLLTGSPWVAFWLWVMANAVNMLDHADGIAAATIAAAAVGMGGSEGHALAGACMGFLVFNYPPARLFMGDSGSLLLGSAVVLTEFGTGTPTPWVWFAVPLLDAGFVVTRRLASGRKPWIGGTDHTGHKLLSLGVPTRLLPLGYAAAASGLGYGLDAML